MRAIIRQSVRRPVAVSMLYLAVGFLAVGAWLNLPIDLQFEAEYPEINITTRWGQASPESVQALVTSPIEALSVTIPGVRNVLSRTSRGSSNVTLELEEDVDVDMVRFELSDRLALIRDEMPPGSSSPQVTPTVPREFEDVQHDTRILSYQVRSTRPLNALRAWAKEEIETPMAAVEGVADVTIGGGEDPYLRVVLDPDLCEHYGISPRDVEQEIEAMARTLPLGQVEMEERAYAVRVQYAPPDLETLNGLALGRAGGNIVHLRDVGTIRPAYEEAESYKRIDGNYVVTVDVTRRTGTDVLTVAEAAKARMEELRATFPADIDLELYYDQAAELQTEFQLLGRRLLLILGIVAVLLLVLMRDLRTPLFLFGTLLAAISLAIIALYHFDVPVNLLTITGLALAFGMLVDNAVVVLENIVRYREAGLSAPEAAERGTSEVVVPVLAATATTVAVFGPFVIFQGRLRDYYMPLALAVAFSLTASFFVALTLMPAAAGRGWVLKAPKMGRDPGKRFRRGLSWSLRHPWVTLAVVGAVGWYAWTVFQEVPGGRFYRFGARDRLQVSITLPPGAEAATADEQIARFEEYVLSLPDVERVEVSVSNYSNAANSGPRATMVVTFEPEVEVTAYPLVVKDELIGMATGFAGVNIGVYGFNPDGYSSGGFGFGPSYNSRIELLGYNYEELGRFGEAIAATAKRHARVQEAVVTAGDRYYRDPGTELVLRVKRDLLTPHGISVSTVIAQVQQLLQGQTTRTRTRVGREEWDLQVKLDGVDRRTLDQVLDAPVRGFTSTGQGLRLRDVMDVQFRSIPGTITRSNQRYQRLVQWEYRGSSRARAAYEEAIFDSIELPPGYMARMPESLFLTREEEQQIRVVAFTALLLIFMILASLYESLIQPFVVLLAVPCALIGVAFIFYFMEKPFDPSAAIGVVLLAGIVVNNAIILVDHINLRRHDGLELVEAILRGTSERVRPILITSLTTIGGLLPLVTVQSEEARQGGQEMWSNLALATIGGLSTATILTLTVLPVLYLLSERCRWLAARLWVHVGRTWHALPGGARGVSSGTDVGNGRERGFQ